MIDREKYNNLEDWDKDKLLSYITKDYAIIEDSYNITNKLVDIIANRDAIHTANIISTMLRQITDLCNATCKDQDKPEYMDIFRSNYIRFINSLHKDLVNSRNSDFEFLSSFVHRPL